MGTPMGGEAVGTTGGKGDGSPDVVVEDGDGDGEAEVRAAAATPAEVAAAAAEAVSAETARATGTTLLIVPSSSSTPPDAVAATAATGGSTVSPAAAAAAAVAAALPSASPPPVSDGTTSTGAVRTGAVAAPAATTVRRPPVFTFPWNGELRLLDEEVGEEGGGGAVDGAGGATVHEGVRCCTQVIVKRIPRGIVDGASIDFNIQLSAAMENDKTLLSGMIHVLQTLTCHTGRPGDTSPAYYVALEHCDHNLSRAVALTQQYVTMLRRVGAGTLETFDEDAAPLLLWRARRSVARQLVSGVAFLHRTGIGPLRRIYHNNLKPTNVLLKNGIVKLSEINCFSHGDTLTGSTWYAGTPGPSTTAASATASAAAPAAAAGAAAVGAPSAASGCSEGGGTGSSAYGSDLIGTCAAPLVIPGALPSASAAAASTRRQPSPPQAQALRRGVSASSSASSGLEDFAAPRLALPAPTAPPPRLVHAASSDVADDESRHAFVPTVTPAMEDEMAALAARVTAALSALPPSATSPSGPAPTPVTPAGSICSTTTLLPDGTPLADAQHRLYAMRAYRDTFALGCLVFFTLYVYCCVHASAHTRTHTHTHPARTPRLQHTGKTPVWTAASVGGGARRSYGQRSDQCEPGHAAVAEGHCGVAGDGGVGGGAAHRVCDGGDGGGGDGGVEWRQSATWDGWQQGWRCRRRACWQRRWWWWYKRRRRFQREDDCSWRRRCQAAWVAPRADRAAGRATGGGDPGRAAGGEPHGAALQPHGWRHDAAAGRGGWPAAASALH